METRTIAFNAKVHDYVGLTARRPVEFAPSTRMVEFLAEFHSNLPKIGGKGRVRVGFIHLKRLANRMYRYLVHRGNGRNT